MSSKKKYFGTDGIRGRVGESIIHPEFVLKLGWAVGKVLANGNRSKVIIGKDTRISGYLLESVLEAGLSAAGVDIELLGPMPTAAVAYLTRTLGAKAGIVISASHNLYFDNGIKFFSGAGKKLAEQVELAIEEKIDMPLEVLKAERLGKATRIVDAPGRYIEFCKSTVPAEMRLSGLKIVIDCANGATYHIAPSVFRELGAEVIEYGVKPDGFNINAGCGSTNPSFIREHVLKNKADLGIAFDGDGDRVVMIDHKGELLGGDELLYLITKDRLQRKMMDEGVVGTVMSNWGLELSLQQMGVKFVRTQVGDRYVIEALEQHGWRLGGEPSGHVLCLDKMTTADGIIAALQVLYAAFNADKTIHELTAGLIKFPQVTLNVPSQNSLIISQDDQVQKTLKDIRKQLKNHGRALLRPSGTEPVIRVMVEGEDKQNINHYAQQLVEVIRKVDSRP